jgi:hypothetical protein
MLFVCRANGGHEAPLLGYPARSLVTISTELFQHTEFDTNIDMYSVTVFCSQGFSEMDTYHL